MDGNRRWAQKQNLMTLFGHRKGIETITTVVNFCLINKIPYLSLYTYSIENLKSRSAEEQYYLFEILAQEAIEDLESFKNKNVCIKFIGNRSLFPQSIQPLCEKIEAETAHCNALQLTFLFCYGSQQEIIAATQNIAKKVAIGELQVNNITQELFEDNLWTSGIPTPDLILRTGAQSRLSNFLLYQAAYSELYFLDCMWPDISEAELDKALDYYTKCQQNFGR